MYPAGLLMGAAPLLFSGMAGTYGGRYGIR